MLINAAYSEIISAVGSRNGGYRQSEEMTAEGVAKRNSPTAKAGGIENHQLKIMKAKISKINECRRRRRKAK
jgi:hypothetical protein